MDFDRVNFTFPHDSVDAVNPDRAPSHVRAFAYPQFVWYFLGSFIAIVSLFHFVTTVVSWSRSNSRVVQISSPRGPWSFRRIPLAILNIFRNVIFRTTISCGSYTLNLTELLLGCGYMAALLTWALINTTNLEGLRLSPQYYANRTGIIAATQFPLMIALGMKNNILTFLTGISFDKLNILHRIAARALCVMLWIHGVGHIIESGRAGNLEDLQQPWFLCGITAISSLTLLCLFSIRPLRSRSYELFLVAHLFLALIVLCGAYYHANNNGFGYFLWPSLMVWGVDRFLRFIRIFCVNGGLFTLFNTKTSHPLRAKVEIISPQFLRVTVRRPMHFRWSPGQLAYLSIPSVSATPWEAHPFTIASIDGDIPRAAESPRLSQDFSDKANSVDKKLVFLLRVHDGFTKRLLNAADSASLPNQMFNMYIDGPYCVPPSVRGFTTVLLLYFVVCGSGISFTLPLLLDVIRAANMGTNSTCRRVVMVWAIRDADQIKAISDDLLLALDGVSNSIAIDIRIHITASLPDESDTEKCEHSFSTSDTKLLQAPAVGIFSGRPNVKEVINSEVGEASRTMSVNVCGTAGMAESVRSALRAISVADILNGGPSVTLHVKAFGM
ncbi:ferric reductase like transmembrane component-domain-containing protein [Mycena alexandri]|uniref:Ferric reductase like transmembrane component-domain-containing protein n=1 Tax=Mycena alexandri TaxID=1745969 RepID=A0AAD6SBM1_9AGAR|nr:ferric reductase like transmembrane component-domain-containing protein [Mycena alexandri]